MDMVNVVSKSSIANSHQITYVNKVKKISVLLVFYFFKTAIIYVFRIPKITSRYVRVVKETDLKSVDFARAGSNTAVGDVFFFLL